MKTSASLLAGAIVFIAGFANAQDSDPAAETTLPDGITLGELGYGGNGCPQGSVNATLGPEGNALAITFDGWAVEAGPPPLATEARGACNLAIPINVPQGISVSLVSVDYRGSNSLPAGARSTFRVEYFFAGSQGPVFNRNFSGPLISDYTIHNELMASAMVWSPCGASPLLRTNASLTVSTNAAGDHAVATVMEATHFRLQSRAC